MLQTVSIVVKGKVQGVYYRQSAKEKALELGISGIINNQPDSTVHILASGTIDQLNHFIAWCKLGPSRAFVTAVDVEYITPRAFIDFTIH